MSRSSSRLLLLSIPLLLTACGEGWEAKLVDQSFPYGNDRTAGSGVVYVRAKLLPEKALNLDTKLDAGKDISSVSPFQRDPAPQPLQNAEPIFSESQSKSYSEQHSSVRPSSTQTIQHVQSSVSKSVVEQVSHNHSQASVVDQSITEGKAVQTQTVAKKLVEFTNLDREQALSKNIKVIDQGVVADAKSAPAFKNTIIEKASDVPVNIKQKQALTPLPTQSVGAVSAVEPQAGGEAQASNTQDVLAEVVALEERIEQTSESLIVQPVKRLVTPKKDIRETNLSVGQETLNEIYNSPF